MAIGAAQGDGPTEGVARPLAPSVRLWQARCPWDRNTSSSSLIIDWDRLRGPTSDRSDENSGPERGQGRMTLRSFRTEHLRSVPSLLELHRDVVARKFLPDSEGGLIAFLGTAERCLRQGRNPAALLRYLAERGKLNAATLEDEERACAALKDHRRARWARSSILKSTEEPDADLAEAAGTVAPAASRRLLWIGTSGFDARVYRPLPWSSPIPGNGAHGGPRGNIACGHELHRATPEAHPRRASEDVLSRPAAGRFSGGGGRRAREKSRGPSSAPHPLENGAYLASSGPLLPCDSRPSPHSPGILERRPRGWGASRRGGAAVIFLRVGRVAVRPVGEADRSEGEPESTRPRRGRPHRI